MAEKIICEVTGADLAGSLEQLLDANIPIENVIHRDPLTLRFQTDFRYGKIVCTILEQRGDRVKLLRRIGISQRVIPWLRHPILIASLLLILFLTVWLPSKVLFIRVEGNDAISSAFILAKAEACGIRFGAERGDVRSEKVKNALLEAIPQLQWAGINTSGCVATISVRERSENQLEKIVPASGIVAARDGVIRSCIVEKGTALCTPGQAVREGETLISGLTDCGRAILVTGAEGEIQAETSRSVMVRTMDHGDQRDIMTGSEEKFSLLIGKKRINFDNGSGILDATCVKMYTEYYLTLPGGFQLPIGICKETIFYHAAEKVENSAGTTVMERWAEEYLLSHMTAGQILESRTTTEGNRLYGEYICLEMIGQNRYEEFTRQDGEIDGENG